MDLTRFSLLDSTDAFDRLDSKQWFLAEVPLRWPEGQGRARGEHVVRGIQEISFSEVFFLHPRELLRCSAACGGE